MIQDLQSALDQLVQKRPWLSACLLTVLIAMFYLYMDTHATLWDRDEPRFCRATAEMIESGNYLVPTFNGKLRPDKPILIYWLMSVPMRLFGPTELACRLPGAMGTALTCLLTFFIGQRLFTPKVGLWAMLILCTSLMLLYMGTAATADAVLLPLLVAQMAVFVAYGQSSKRYWGVLLMGLTMGGALLAKGPVGLFPFLALGVTCWLARKQPLWTWRVRELLLAMVIGTILFLAWAIPANQATHGEFLRMGIGHHVLKRSAQPLEHHGGRFLISLPYYIPVVVLGFFPWILFFPRAFRATWKDTLSSPGFRSLFIGWVLPLLLVMTLVATKLPHYILFMWPALALAVAAHLKQAPQPNEAQWGFWLYFTQGLLGSITLISVPWFLGIPGLGLSLSACGLVLLAEVFILTQAYRKKQTARQAGVLVGYSILFMLIFVTAVLPCIESIKITPTIVRLIKAHQGDGLSIATYGYAEPSLNFYLGQQLDHLDTDLELVAWIHTNEPGLLIISDACLRAQVPPPPLVSLGSQRGFHYTKGKSMTVHVLKRQAR